MNSSSERFATRSIVQRRLNIDNWNPGLRRRKEDTFEQQFAGRWHVITLQEASEYVDHELLTSRFHVTHFAGSAILFNKDTFYFDIEVKSICLHDTRRDLLAQVMEGEQGWVLQGVLSGASFCGSPASGQKYSALSTYEPRLRQGQRHLQEAHSYSSCHDFNGTAWRCRSRDNLSTNDEAFTDCALPTLGVGSIPDKWADVCGFLSHRVLTVLESEQTWCIFHPAEIPSSTSHRSKLSSRNVASFGV